MDLDALDSFVVFAEKKNFTHAADALHISQPALHAKIRRLGESLGVELYRRHGRALEITHAGRSLARFGREMRGSVEFFVARLRGEPSLEPVVLAAGEGAILYLFGSAIREFAASGAPLQVLTRDRDGVIEALRAGEAHLGVAALDAVPPDLESTELARARQIVVLPPQHPLRRKRELALSDLAGASLIVPPAGRPHRETIARALRDAGVSWRVAVEANGWPVMLELVRSGVGLAIVNSTCTLPKPLIGRPLRGIPATHYHLLRARGRISEGARTLAALIRVAART
jgi:DNA-binding transcriptional LysR family regulator